MTVHAGLRGTGPWLRALLFLPVVTPTIVAAVAWRVLFKEEGGVLNNAFALVGIGPIPWLTGWPWVLLTAMVVTLWKGFGYYMMIFLAGLMAVPRELEEAAGIDGAEPVGHLSPRDAAEPEAGARAGLAHQLDRALKVFDELWVVARGVPADSKTVVPLIYETAFDGGSFGAACAIGRLPVPGPAGLFDGQPSPGVRRRTRDAPPARCGSRSRTTRWPASWSCWQWGRRCGC